MREFAWCKNSGDNYYINRDRAPLKVKKYLLSLDTYLVMVIPRLHPFSCHGEFSEFSEVLLHHSSLFKKLRNKREVVNIESASRTKIYEIILRA